MFKLYMLIYNLIIYIIQPFIWIKLLWISKKIPCYRQNFLERYGFYRNKKIQSNGIILHAVSLGETLLTKPLINELKKHYPDIAITLTTMTPSGMKIARQFQTHYNYHIQCFYLPYDLPCSIKRFIKKFNPKLFVIIEKELWPNLINILYQQNIPIIIANARLSEQSFTKYKKIRYFLYHIMQRITIVAAQYKEDANRFLKLGLKNDQLHLMGNIKFDIKIKHNLLKNNILSIKNNHNNRLIWIASSTHSGEEILLLHAHKILLNTFSNLLMILVPRHPERFTNLIKIIKNFKLSYIIQQNDFNPKNNTQVIIYNTIGNLMKLYSISDIAFIGGSLIPHGGHNPIEPAIYKIPLITGPYIFNFQKIYDKLSKLDGLIKVTDTESLVYTISTLLQNRTLRLYYGHHAAEILKDNTGALKRLMCLITTILS